MRTAAEPARCPLLGGDQATDGTRAPFEQIRRALDDDFSTRIADEHKQHYTPAASTVPGPFADWGLHNFSPAVATGADFYRLLDRSGYYNETTWEAMVVAGAIAQEDDVVGFGCRDSAVFKSLQPRSGPSVGVGNNGEAAAVLRRAGVELWTSDFRTFASGDGDSFDVAWAMQVLEQLADALPCGDALLNVGKFVPGHSRLAEFPSTARR